MSVDGTITTGPSDHLDFDQTLPHIQGCLGGRNISDFAIESLYNSNYKGEQRYEEDRNLEIMKASAEVEYEGYCQWTRVQEIMEFAKKIGARKIGIANCIGLINEARIFARILRANGFEPYAVICKVEGRAKTSMGIPAKCEEIGPAMCNPILQARLLNQAGTDLNVVIGLCVGHDSLFYRYSDAYVTTLVTKDRVTGNNPAAALYTAGSYYKKKFGV